MLPDRILARIPCDRPRECFARVAVGISSITRHSANLRKGGGRSNLPRELVCSRNRCWFAAFPKRAKFPKRQSLIVLPAIGNQPPKLTTDSSRRGLKRLCCRALTRSISPIHSRTTSKHLEP